MISGRRFDRAAANHPLETGQAGSRANSFDALRLLAALAVLVSHVILLAGSRQPTLATVPVAFLAVLIFFGMSGFLISQSWASDPRFWPFLVKRALRILPALLVALMLTVVLLGPAVTTLPASEYLTNGDTWRYLVRSSLLFVTSDLPGVFAGNPFSREVNAPLWTLTPEIWAYLGLGCLGLAGALRRRWVTPVVAAIAIALVLDPAGVFRDSREIVLLQAFAVGASLCVLRRDIPWHGAIATVLLAAFVFASGRLQLSLAAVALPYTAILLAHRRPATLRRLTARGDFSYGIYVYHWPVGQVVAAAWAGAGAPAMLAITLPLTCLLAVASWRLVERPALKLKRFVAPRPEPAARGAHASREPTVRSGPLVGLAGATSGPVRPQAMAVTRIPDRHDSVTSSPSIDA